MNKGESEEVGKMLFHIGGTLLQKRIVKFEDRHKLKDALVESFISYVKDISKNAPISAKKEREKELFEKYGIVEHHVKIRRQPGYSSPLYEPTNDLHRR